MLALDPALLATIAADAKAKAAQHPRWLVAIDRAMAELETNPYLEWQDGHLLILSESGNVYASNGVCQCEAYRFKIPCWHRAAARMVRLHNEQATLTLRPKVTRAQALAEINELF